jgi:hypothetical protein
MAKDYQQVTFEKPSENGVFVDTIWIEADLAKEGEYRKRKIAGLWVDGWKITKVHPGIRNHEEVMESRDLHKDHRKGTDI